MSVQSLSFYYDIHDPSFSSTPFVIKETPNYIAHDFAKSAIYDSITNERIGYQVVDIYVQQVETDKFIVREFHTCYFDNNGTDGGISWIYSFMNDTASIYYQPNIPVLTNIVSTNAGYYGKTGSVSLIPLENGIRNVTISFAAVCVGPDTKVLLEDSVYKKISELKRGDRVVQDVKTHAVKTISRVLVSLSNSCITIPKALLGNKENVLITQNHPIWVNGDKNRIYPKHVSGGKREGQRNKTC